MRGDNDMANETTNGITYYFCLIPADVCKKNDIGGRLSVGGNIGARFVYKNRQYWHKEDANEWCKYLTAGYMKGIDFVHKDNKTYQIFKTYMDLDLDAVIIVGFECIAGCETID